MEDSTTDGPGAEGPAASSARHKAIRVVIADDHAVVRGGIRQLLEQEDGIDVVGEAGDGEEALEMVRSVQPDVLLLDVELPGRSGVEVARELSEEAPGARILALSSYDDPEYVRGLMESGASGYLTKEEAPRRIVEAVRAVARGEARYFARPAAGDHGDAEGGEPAARLRQLTDREQEVLRLMAEGRSNRAVAETLCVSEHTVKSHASSIYAKLGVASGRAAVALAWESGLMDE